MEVISSILGPAGYAITADIYAQVGSVVQQEAADAMDRADRDGDPRLSCLFPSACVDALGCRLAAKF